MILTPVELGQPFEVERRNPIGWILIALVIALMLVISLTGYFSPERTAETTISQAEMRLKVAVEMREANGTPAKLDESAKTLEPYLAKEPEADLVYAEIQAELKRPIRPADLAALKKSKKSEHQVAYEVLSSDRLTEARARELAAQIPRSRFAYKLLAADALEKGGIKNGRDQILGTANVPGILIAGIGIVLACSGGLVLLFAYGIVRASGRAAPKGIPLPNLSPSDADRLAMRCAQYLLLFIGAQVFVALFMRGALTRDYADIPVYFIIIAGMIWLAQIPVGGKLISLRTLGLHTENLGKDILWALGAAMANAPIIAVVALASNAIFSGLPQAEHPVTFELQGATSWLLIGKLILTACVFAPFVEEILFRATLFPALNGVWRRLVLAGVVSSLIFGMIHPTGIPAWFPLAAIGGMSCFLTHQTRSIIPSMVMHGVHNFVTLAFTLLVFR